MTNADLSLEEMLALPDFETAVARTRPFMQATADEENNGTLLLAAWASVHLKWADVAVARNETSFEEVWSGGEGAFGKRMSHHVTLVQSTAADVEGQPVHAGLAEAQGQLISFFAVGDITPLLEDEPAHFHGVVTGTYTYGPQDAPRRAVTMVGLFDAPANRARRG